MILVFAGILWTALAVSLAMAALAVITAAHCLRVQHDLARYREAHGLRGSVQGGNVHDRSNAR